jgi:hypothetical protein
MKTKWFPASGPGGRLNVSPSLPEVIMFARNITYLLGSSPESSLVTALIVAAAAFAIRHVSISIAARKNR